MSAVVLGEETLNAHREARCIGLHKSVRLAIFVLVGIYAGAAPAGDRPLAPAGAFAREAQPFRRAELGSASIFSAPFSSLTSSSESQEFSANEFRPRKRNILELESGNGRNPLLDAPMLKSNSVFQHMSDFKSQGRVRLLTLWQMRGSSLSLQAGKHGSPSLQWSTPWVHGGGTSRGLFDRLLPLPQHPFERNARGNMPRDGIRADAIENFGAGVGKQHQAEH